MKAISFVKLSCIIILGICLLGGCTHNDLYNEFPTEERQRHTCKMTFIGGINGFDGTRSNAKVASSTWQNGDKIYITFYNGTTMVPGEAVYNSSSGWTVSYDGNLATGSNQKCEARFFVNATRTDSYLITLNPNTEIYEDVEGAYTYRDGALTVQAFLMPKTGRIRFTGTSGSKINLTGITTYSAYSADINRFTTSVDMIKETVTNGSTPYVYGYFTHADRGLCIIGNDFAFTRNCSDAVLREGESGYMAIPSEASHNNWSTGAYITLGNEYSGIQIKMLPVAGHIDGFFLMAETETTEQVWDIVRGSSSPTNSTLPKVDVSYNDVWTFIYKIGSKPGMHFSLPTLEQWQYAAKGGNKSQGYTYAGSNVLGDVAWYAANTTARQPVKTKAPNELGLYDMCGNVDEWTRTYRNSGYCWCGGAYNSSNIDILSSYYYPDNSGNYFIGFRLILTCP